jgi:oxygen-independent coproporphyrinogen-3 oxidase
LDNDERQRRWVIQSLLFDGLDLAEFEHQFGTNAREVFRPQWEALHDEDCIATRDQTICLTPRGIRHSDVVGQLFFSDRVRRLMDTYEYDA